jgi:holo-[acyl-carrier protein] synthase
MSEGVGIDLVEIERLERALERRPGLADRVFRPGELAYASSRRRPGPYLAARFAAKEAALKALGLGGLGLREVEVEGGDRRPPTLRLHGRAAEAAERQGVTLAVSLTHSRNTAGAVVVSRKR